MASIEIITNAWPVRDVLPLLLFDRSSRKNIIFATESYAAYGEEYRAKNQITEQILTSTEGSGIQPRVLKDSDEQLLRTRRKAEVFTPAWVCCLMNNHIDEAWFGRPDVFGKLNGQEWTPTEDLIQMPKRRRWQTYVDSRRLEITCGEAPYLVSRYDTVTGEIIPIKKRTGILDRKLRIVKENTVTEKEWLKWTLRAFQSVYGYEYQGDNLLIARINLMMTYIDYMQDRWNRKPTNKELNEITKVISWNIWQMDGLKGTIPLEALYEEHHQFTIFEIFGLDDVTENEELEEYIPCRIYDWRGQNKSVEFKAFREGRNGSMKFDFIIGNPPYQDETLGDNKGFAPPIYDKFMEEAYTVSDKVELIHPARFLFNAGSTPKAWNKKMLEDKHFKVLKYWSNEHDVFPGQIINGGVAISYHDSTADFGAIEIFSQFPELNAIRKKVCSKHDFTSFSSIVYTAYAYHFTEKLYSDHPELVGRMSAGHQYDTKSNVFDLMPEIFTDKQVSEKQISILGRRNNTRATAFIDREYISAPDNLDSYKVVISAADGASGTVGKPIPARIVGAPTIAFPGQGSTESFASIGRFDNEQQAKNLLKYIKSRFSRTLLAVLKVTQHITPVKWRFVPLQDFTEASDIDWSQSIADIDRQLYVKYCLSDEEITFIETYVKEME